MSTTGAAMPRPQRILQLIDPSPSSDYALDWTIQNLILNKNAEITLLTVAEPYMPPDFLATDELSLFSTFAADPVLRAQEYDKVKKEAELLLNALRERCVAQGVDTSKVQTAVVLESGGVASTVKTYVDLNHDKIDLVVLGSRGLGAVRRWLASVADAFGAGLGSVSTYCVHNLNRPVLVIKRPKNDAEAAAGKHRGRAKAATTGAAAAPSTTATPSTATAAAPPAHTTATD